MNLKMLIAASAAAFVMVCPTVAQAADTSSDDLVRVSVPYPDLDLTTEVGQVLLSRRVNSTIAQICGDRNLRDLAGRTAARACYRIAKAGATRDIQLAANRVRQLAANKVRAKATTA